MVNLEYLPLHALHDSSHRYFDSQVLVLLIYFLIPSKPACKIVAKAMYGFAAGSTERISTRVDKPREDGTRTNGERFYHSKQYNLVPHSLVQDACKSLRVGYKLL